MNVMLSKCFLNRHETEHNGLIWFNNLIYWKRWNVQVQSITRFRSDLIIRLVSSEHINASNNLTLRAAERSIRREHNQKQGHPEQKRIKSFLFNMGLNYDFSNWKWKSLSPQIKFTDARWSENPQCRVKNQRCRRPIEWPIKTSAREALRQ